MPVPISAIFSGLVVSLPPGIMPWEEEREERIVGWMRKPRVLVVKMCCSSSLPGPVIHCQLLWCKWWGTGRMGDTSDILPLYCFDYIGGYPPFCGLVGLLHHSFVGNYVLC